MQYNIHVRHIILYTLMIEDENFNIQKSLLVCGTLKCENASICEKGSDM